MNNIITMHIDKPIIQISSDALASVYPTEGYFTARFELEDMSAIGNTAENAAENLVALFHVTIMEWYQTNQLEDKLMKYGWSAEIHSENNILYIEPPLKIKVLKKQYNLSEDDLEIVETIESIEDMKKILQLN